MRVEGEKILTIVLWLWRDLTCRTQYTPEHVNICARMIDRHLALPHRFIVFTDNVDANFDSNIKPHQLWDDYHLLKNPAWRVQFPQCYVRLKAFSRDDEMREILGPRFVSVDLDCVVVGDLDPLFSRDEDFLIYRHPVQQTKDRLQPYNGSLWMMNTGARAQVWENFKGAESLKQFVNRPDKEHFLQTDQGWICAVLGTKEPGWGMEDGVYMWSYLHHKVMKLPADARIVFFNGAWKPEDYFWIKENYR